MARSTRPRGKAQRRGSARDVAMVVGRTDDEEGYHVLRRRGEDPVELGTMRPLKDGEVIDGEVIALRPRKDVPFVYDVKTKLPARQQPQRRLTSDGPPQVATEEYRRGWDSIWGNRREGAKGGGKLN